MSDCIYHSVVYSWIRLWESMFAKSEDLLAVEKCLAKSQAMQSLEGTLSKYDSAEGQLCAEINQLSSSALMYKRSGDLQGARRAIIKRQVTEKQLKRVHSAQEMVFNHLHILRNTEMNNSLISTLKASGSVLRAMNLSSDPKDAEDIMFDLEAEMYNVNEISSVLAKPLDRGDCTITDAELERELCDLEKVPAAGQEAEMSLFSPDAEAALPPSRTEARRHKGDPPSEQETPGERGVIHKDPPSSARAGALLA